MSKTDSRSRTPWDVFDEGDLEVLANLRDFVQEQHRKRYDRIAFHVSVWSDALDATGDPLFARDPEVEAEYKRRLALYRDEK